MKHLPLTSLLAASLLCCCEQKRPEPAPTSPEPEATDVTAKIAEASGRTPKAPPWFFEKAKPLPSLEEAGMAAEPAFSDHFGTGWSPANHGWRVATWQQNGTLMSPERCAVDAEGHLVQTVLAGEPPRGGSMQTDREFGWGRWVARVKPSAVPGLLNSIFTKDWDDLTTPVEHDGRKAEVDIEFVTHSFGPGKGEVHLAIHLAKHHPLWDLDIPVDFNPSDGFREWGFDILPDRVVWHMDGKILHEWSYTPEHRVDPGYEFFFNSWTRKKWLKGPPAANAHYLIDWVKFFPLENQPAAGEP